MKAVSKSHEAANEIVDIQKELNSIKKFIELSMEMKPNSNSKKEEIISALENITKKLNETAVKSLEIASDLHEIMNKL